MDRHIFDPSWYRHSLPECSVSDSLCKSADFAPYLALVGSTGCHCRSHWRDQATPCAGSQGAIPVGLLSRSCAGEAWPRAQVDQVLQKRECSGANLESENEW